MFKMLLRSRRYAGQFFKRRSWDLSTPPKVPNPYGAGYNLACTLRTVPHSRRADGTQDHRGKLLLTGAGERLGLLARLVHLEGWGEG